MTDVVRTAGLTKSYGAATVVSDVDLTVPEGVVYGLLGPNGSGKSTTMKMLLSLTRPTSGSVELFGRPMTRGSRAPVLRDVGSLIEAPPGYAHLTGAQNMRIVRDLLGAQDADVASAVGAVRMEAQMGKRLREYSLGMKQRLGIAMALTRNPRLLILDEPTNGLDPAGIEEIRELIVSLARDQGRTVIVSSHLLDEIERMATMLGILNQGRMIFQGTMGDLFEAQRPDLFIRTPDPTAAAHTLTGQEFRVEPDGVVLPGLDEPSAGRVLAQLIGAGIPVWEACRRQRSLEEVFIGLTGRGGLS